MRRTTLFICLCSLVLSCLPGKKKDIESTKALSIEGLWWSLLGPWKTPPPEVELPGLEFQHAVIIQFCPNGSFFMIYCLVERSNGICVISRGDGLAFLEGRWRKKGEAVEVKYKYTFSTSPPKRKIDQLRRWHFETIKRKGDKIELEGRTYERAGKFSKSTENEILKCPDMKEPWLDEKPDSDDLKTNEKNSPVCFAAGQSDFSPMACTPATRFSCPQRSMFSIRRSLPASRSPGS